MGRAVLWVDRLWLDWDSADDSDGVGLGVLVNEEDKAEAAGSTELRTDWSGVG